MERVMLPREVAEAIEDVKPYYRNGEIIETIVKDDNRTVYGTLMGRLIRYYRDDCVNLETLMSALVNGYEIERTPEERLREYYERVQSNRRVVTRAAAVTYYDFELRAIENTLDILGITIEGINA